MFRDSFDLQRHNQRKIPCKLKIEKLKKINEINEIGNEDLLHIDTDCIINEITEINKIFNDPYTRAGKLIAFFHKLVNETEKNKNIKLPNIKSMIAKVYTKNNWVNESTIEVLFKIIKIRSTQLLLFKETIKDLDENFFKLDVNKQTWVHIKLFAKYGYDHNGINDTTRGVRGIIKIALLNVHATASHL